MHFVCIHGVLHGGWCWEKTREDLEANGHTLSTPDLPLTSLEEDANAVVSILDSIEGPCVLVGHSYGGSVMSKAAEHRSDVLHLVYVAAIMIAKHDVFLEAATRFPSELANHMRISDDGETFTITEEGAQKSFYNCCESTVAAAATARLRPTSMSCLTTPSGAEPWVSIPSTYIICDQDKAITAEHQRIMAKRARYIVELGTDHSPFYSLRDPFAAALLDLV